WAPRSNELGRLTGEFQPLLNFDFLPITCADFLGDVKRDASALQAKSLDDLMCRMRCPEAQIAACLIWRLYREWRLYQIKQLWLDGYEFPAQPHLFPLNWAMPIARLVERIDFWEDRTKTARALCHRTKNLLFTSRFASELLERYLRLFETTCDRIE